MSNQFDVMNEIEKMRDELKLKKHLLGMEAKEKWRDLESKYTEVAAKVSKAGDTASDVAEDLGRINKLAINKIKDGYKSLRDDLTH